MIKFVCCITLSFIACLYTNLMAQDSDPKQPPSHQTTADSQKSSAGQPSNNEDNSKPEGETPQSSKKEESDWTKVAPIIIAIFGLLFGI